MSDSNSSQETSYGFLTVVEIDQLGFCGGLLILSSKGRPIEFHCTAPTTANSAQQILYGQTLKPFLFCDQIGMALVEKSKSNLSLIITLDTELIGLTDFVETPVVVLATDNNSETFDGKLGQQIEIEEQAMSISCHRSGQTEQAEQMIRHFMETLPLTEPFERIQQAISAAHKVAA